MVQYPPQEDHRHEQGNPEGFVDSETAEKVRAELGETKARLFTGRETQQDVLELTKGDGARGNESFGKEGVSVQWVMSAWLAHRLPGTRWETPPLG